MEGSKFQNNNEKVPSVRIVSKKTQNELISRMGWGKPISNDISEFIKIYAIMNSIAQKNISSEVEAGKMVLDLWDEFDVKLFEPEDFFTKDAMKQILSANKVEEFSLTLNGGPINIRSGSTTESVMKEWKEALDADANSPEAIAKQEAADKKYKEKVQKAQKEADQMFANLEKLDMKNIDSVLQWLIDYNEHVSYSGVENHMEDITKKFEENGYSPEKNNVADFMVADTLKDRKMMTENFIGYLLVNMGMIRPGDVVGIEKKLREME